MIEILAGILGALIGSSITYWLTQRAQRTAFAFDLHRELHTVEMGRHRYKAEQLVRNNPTLSFNQLNEQYVEDVDSLLAVFRFFQRLGLAVKYRQIHESIACEMFAGMFYYWNYPIFESKFEKAEVNGREHIMYLGKWFYQTIALDEHERLKAYNHRLWTDRGIV
jgi:hypothetical protein